MKIFAANWKMNHSFDELDQWLDQFLKSYKVSEDVVVVCPPALLLDYADTELMEDSFEQLELEMKNSGANFEDFSAEELNKILLQNRPIKLGAQDCHFQQNGSFTGDISAEMLSKIGCEYVILGHSERRAGHFETDEIVAKKVRAALSQNLTPIICVGESKETRDQGKHLEFVYRQIMNSVPNDVKFDKLVIAYEPIWSIGTGVVPSTEQIAEMAKLIKKIFNEKMPNLAKEYFMLYGGSVTSQNSAEILKIENVNGLLVGKASLDAEEFLKICSSSFEPSLR